MQYLLTQTLGAGQRGRELARERAILAVRVDESPEVYREREGEAAGARVRSGRAQKLNAKRSTGPNVVTWYRKRSVPLPLS